MGRMLMTTALLLGLVVGIPAARAGEADDLQVMIERGKSGVNDLERLDERGAVRDDTTLLKAWYDQAWGLRGEQAYDEVRVMLQRCDAQTEMIRQKIEASKLAAVAAEKEEGLRKVRENIDKTKKAIQQAMLQKAALEARAK